MNPRLKQLEDRVAAQDEQIESLERGRTECLERLDEAEKCIKELRGKYEALLLYVTRPSGASLSQRNVMKSARQGGVMRPLVPARKVNDENSDSREGSPTPGKPVQCSGRSTKRGLTLQNESNNILARMERREKRPRAAVAITRSRVVM